MNRRELEKEGADLKLIILLLLKRIWMILSATLAGALIAGLIYGIVYHNTLDQRKYTAESKYYIMFKETMDKSYLDHYYNGYTWNDLLSSDLILGYAMTLLPQEYDRNYVSECVKAEILSDVRVLTTTVAADTPEEVIQIRSALEQAVIHFGTVGENLEQITLIRSGEPVLEDVADEWIRAFLTGAVIGMLISIVVLLLLLALQDAVYLPEQFKDRYGIPVAGMENYEAWLERNLAYLTNGKNCLTVSMQEVLADGAFDYEKARQSDGVILQFPQGRANSKKLTAALEELRIQDCRVLCAVMTDVDAGLMKWYYGR